MVDKEKVIKGLNNIGREIVNTIWHGEAVPYLRTINDALALLKEQEKPNGKCVNECECWDSAYERGKQDALKEQEAVEPIPYHRSDGTIFKYECRKCRTKIFKMDLFCRHCGRAVKWK